MWQQPFWTGLPQPLQPPPPHHSGVAIPVQYYLPPPPPPCTQTQSSEPLPSQLSSSSLSKASTDGESLQMYDTAGFYNRYYSLCSQSDGDSQLYAPQSDSGRVSPAPSPLSQQARSRSPLVEADLSLGSDIERQRQSIQSACDTRQHFNPKTDMSTADGVSPAGGRHGRPDASGLMTHKNKMSSQESCGSSESCQVPQNTSYRQCNSQGGPSASHVQNKSTYGSATSPTDLVSGLETDSQGHSRPSSRESGECYNPSTGKKSLSEHRLAWTSKTLPGQKPSSREKVLRDRHWNYTAYGYMQRQSNHKTSPEEFHFSVASYNLLSQDLLEANQVLYGGCNVEHLQWEYRSKNLLGEIRYRRPDVLCLQEMNCWHYEDFFVELVKHGKCGPQTGHVNGDVTTMHKLGEQPQLVLHTLMPILICYDGLYQKRSGDKLDGCAIFFKTQRLELVRCVPVEYLVPGVPVLDRDNVALLMLLKVRSKSATPNLLCVATTHLLFNPRRGDVKLAQLCLLLAEIDKLAFKECSKDPWNPQYHPVILCGDFNLEPHCDIYRFLLEGRLHYEGLLTRTLSGQEDGRYGRDVFLAKDFLSSKAGLTDGCQFMSHFASRVHQYVERCRATGKSAMSSDTAAEGPLRSPENLAFSGQTQNTQGAGTLFHRLPLVSVYSHFLRTERSKGWMKEVTTHHGKANCTVDYLLYSVDHKNSQFKNRRVVTSNVQEGALKLVGTLKLVTDRQMKELGSLPNDVVSSDHIMLIAKFVLKLNKK